MQGLQHRIETNQKQWWAGEIIDHFAHTLLDIEVIEWIGFTRIGGTLDQDDQDIEVDRYAKLSLGIGGCRAWSKLGQRIPPFSCAGAASADRVVGQAVVNRMKEEWEAWMWLEREAPRNPIAAEILKELVWPRKKGDTTALPFVRKRPLVCRFPMCTEIS